MNLENIIKEGSKILEKSNIRTHKLDAEIIISNIMKIKKESLVTENKIDISKKIFKKYSDAIKRRSKNEPIAYIIGKKEFWSRDFVVNQSTLIPRPETELMLYKLVNFFKNKSINILDIGTGSGCILLSILKELNLARGTGIDISAKAIQIAKLNSEKLNLNHRAKFNISNIDKFCNDKYDLIISNPPYIPLKDMKNLSKDIKNYEPLVALNGGFDGLDLIKKVIYKSTYLLKNNGLLAIEIGNGQYLKVSSLLKKFKFRETGKEYDYKRNVRCIIGTKR